MDKTEEFLKKDSLIKKYSNKPIPNFLKYIKIIKELDKYDAWKKETNIFILNWIISYLIILPFVLFLCLTAVSFFKTPPMLENFFRAEGISLGIYLLLSLIKQIRGAIKNG